MKIIPLFSLLLLAITARSQTKESFYVFNADWKPTKVDSARYFLHIHRVNDSCWQWDYYNFAGPLLKTEQFRDKDGKELDGISHHYNEKGWIDSISTYRRGMKNGDFMKLCGDSFSVVMKYTYRDDSLVEVIDVKKQKKDSSITYADERESEYPGKTRQWSRYLSKNITYPERALNANIEGEVRVDFIVGKEGEILEPYIAKSVEYSLDEESLRMIRESGKWIPAFQNGRVVKSYKIQPITFRLK